MIPVRASRRPLACSVAVTLTIATFVGPVASAGMGDRMLAMINRKREAHGLHDLGASRHLVRKARAHTRRMIRLDSLFHSRLPEPLRWHRSWGENVGCGPSVRRVMRAMMRSPEHRANILARGIGRFGFGVAAADGRLYGVQDFAGPGVPRGQQKGQTATPLPDAQVPSATAEAVNAARRDAGVSPVDTSEALTEAARSLLPAPGSPTLELKGDLAAPIPADRRRDFAALAAAKALADADRSWLSRLVSRRVPLADHERALEHHDDDVKVVLQLGD
jgi:uncharacterized protein YkwD